MVLPSVAADVRAGSATLLCKVEVDGEINRS